MKPCERCGQPMTRKPREYIKDWLKRRFCSRSCIRAHVPERRCGTCDRVLVRRHDGTIEPISNFRRRKYCDMACVANR